MWLDLSCVWALCLQSVGVDSVGLWKVQRLFFSFLSFERMGSFGMVIIETFSENLNLCSAFFNPFPWRLWGFSRCLEKHSIHLGRHESLKSDIEFFLVGKFLISSTQICENSWNRSVDSEFYLIYIKGGWLMHFVSCEILKSWHHVVPNILVSFISRMV